MSHTRCGIAFKSSAFARAKEKILRMARTIADVNHSEADELAHLNEAINYGMLDRVLLQ